MNAKKIQKAILLAIVILSGAQALRSAVERISIHFRIRRNFSVLLNRRARLLDEEITKRIKDAIRSIDSTFSLRFRKLRREIDSKIAENKTIWTSPFDSVSPADTQSINDIIGILKNIKPSITRAEADYLMLFSINDRFGSSFNGPNRRFTEAHAFYLCQQIMRRATLPSSES